MTFPGADVLGRGVVVFPGTSATDTFVDAPRVRIDDSVLAQPQATADLLHRLWNERRRVVIELAVAADALRAPEAEVRPPYELDPGFAFERERLQFLVWANTYDARKPDGPPIWWHGVRATRLGASPAPDGPGDVVLADGRPAVCDGGPRRPLDPSGPDQAALVVVHRDSIDAGRLTPARFRPPATELAPDQLTAVAHPGGPARIIAPAGSGKTRVLVERIRHLLVDRGHEPEVTTAVAYNVLAAEQLKERTAGFSPTIRTLNSLGLSVCQRRGSWRLADEPLQRDILNGLVKAKGQRRVNTDPLAPYLDALSAIRLGLIPPATAERWFPDAAGVAEVFSPYRAALHRQGCIDFDDQIYLAVELLLADPTLRAEVRQSTRTLLVDEFQDLTPAHLLLIRLLAGPAADVFGVGDDDQVIYGYAGATPGFLIDYGRYFPGAATYDLQTNYRCSPGIVTAAATLLSHNARRIEKMILAARPQARQPQTQQETAVTVRLEPAEQLGPAAVDQVQQWADAGVAYGDMAILTRVNSTLLAAQVLLTEAKVPCRAAVGPWILERAGLSAALAYLRMAADPDRISRADVRATIRRPSRRISPKVTDMLTRDPVTSLRKIRGLATWLEDKDSFAKEAPRVEEYAAALDGIVALVANPGATTATVLAHIRDVIGLGEAMDTLDASKGTLDRSSNGDDLAALLQVAHLHPDPGGFENWLREVLASGRGSGAGGPDPRDAGGVHLATVHRVKGREWPRVAVFGADAGLFPHKLAEDDEEERRIFHVAITRAKDQVVLLGDATAPSPFLDELTRPAPPRPEPRSLADHVAQAAAGVGEEMPAGWAVYARERTPKAPNGPTAKSAKGKAAKAGTGGGPVIHAAVGLVLAGPGPSGEVKALKRGAATLDTGETVSFGTAVRANGASGRLVAPAERIAAATAALTAWRATLAKQEGKPAYVYLSNAHITDIAERDPDTTDRLARCAGIGPAKLEAYGDALLTLLDDLPQP